MLSTARLQHLVSVESRQVMGLHFVFLGFGDKPLHYFRLESPHSSLQDTQKTQS